MKIILSNLDFFEYVWCLEGSAPTPSKKREGAEKRRKQVTEKVDSWF